MFSKSIFEIGQGQLIGSIDAGNKILVFDIETLPAVWLNYGRRVHSTYLNSDNMVSPGFMYCWSASWVGGDKIHSDRLNQRELKGGEDRRLAENLVELLNSADIVVAHNSDKFDVPEVRKTIIRDDGTTPLKVKTYDTLRVARRLFKDRLDQGNSLRWLADYLGVPEPKGSPPVGWYKSLLLDHDNKVGKAVDEYCQQDTIVLKQVYQRLRKHDVV